MTETYPKHIAKNNVTKEYLTEIFTKRHIEHVHINNNHQLPRDDFINEVIQLNDKKKLLKQNLDEARAKHNKLSSHKNITKEDIEIATKSKLQLQKDEENYKIIETISDHMLSIIPAKLHTSVPKENVIVRSVGSISPKIKQHEYSGLISDTVFGSKLVVKDIHICKLERALSNWCMDELERHHFVEKGIPSLIKQSILYEVGHLPHSAKDMFLIDDKYGLSPTGEVGLMAFLSHTNHKSAQYICTVNQCYRGESGASGTQNKGLYRLHEFTKCEMVAIAPANESYDILKKMVDISASMIEKLGLPMRVVELGETDIGNHSAKTYDIESCVNGQWTEVASISNCEDYQTLGLNIKINGETCHSLNGTGIALSRVVAAIIEIYYNEHTKTFDIPQVLKPYYILGCN